MPKVPKTTSLQYQGKHEVWSWFFVCWQMLKVFSNWYYQFRCVWPGMLKLLKITSLIFLSNMLRNILSDAVDFLRVDNHESLLQIDTKIFSWVWSSIPKVLKISSLQCLYNISKKKWTEFILGFIKIKTSTSWIIYFWWK